MSEWKVIFDSKRNSKDSILLYHYEFDQLGQLIEKRYRFSEKNQTFISHKYNYTEANSIIDTIISNPYSEPITVLDGAFIPPTNYCEERDDKGRLENVWLTRGLTGREYSFEFYYNYGFYRSIYITERGQLTAHHFDFSFYPSYKY